MLVSRGYTLGNSEIRNYFFKFLSSLLPLNNFVRFMNCTEKNQHFYLKGLAPKDINLYLPRVGVKGRMRVEGERIMLWNKKRGKAQTLRLGNGGNREDVLEFWKCGGIWGDCVVGLGCSGTSVVILCPSLSHVRVRTAAFRQTSWPWARVLGTVNECRSEVLPQISVC